MNYHFEIKSCFICFFFTVKNFVNVCPRNKHGASQASTKLGCGNDTYGNNQYLCLPNESKTSLVEFCFQGGMGLVEKGTFNCEKEILIELLSIVNKVIT